MCTSYLAYGYNFSSNCFPYIRLDFKTHLLFGYELATRIKGLQCNLYLVVTFVIAVQ